MSIIFIHGHKNFLRIVDDLNRHIWAFMIHSKGEARTLLWNFIAYVKYQYGKIVKIIRSDNEPEFNCVNFYHENGITHQRSCVETPQQNVIVERKHRHILNVARSLIFQSNLPKSYWTYAITHAIHLINKLPTPISKNKCLYEIIHNEPPTFLDLKVFGCLCYASTLENNGTRFDARARKGVFIRYETGIKGYIVLDIKTREIFVNINVFFYENIFPYKNSEGTNQTGNSEPNNIDFYDYISIENDIVSTDQTDFDIHVESNPANASKQPLEITTNATQIRRSERARRIPNSLKYYHHQVNCSDSIHNSVHFKNNLKTLYPISIVLSYHSLSEIQLNFTLAISFTNEP